MSSKEFAWENVTKPAHKTALLLVQKIRECKSTPRVVKVETGETDKERATRLARSVSFISGEERCRYAGAIYQALRWARKLESAEARKPGAVEVIPGIEDDQEREDRIRENFERSVKLQQYYKQI